MVATLMMLAKFATLGLLKITVFWNKSCDVIIAVNDVTKKLSRDANYLVDGLCDQSLVTLAFLWKTLS